MLSFLGFGWIYNRIKTETEMETPLAGIRMNFTNGYILFKRSRKYPLCILYPLYFRPQIFNTNGTFKCLFQL